ncbi:hypothetical protein QAD02_007900 [Eretmocerus hayati]|uniref:Uncharacterized protein n=1 Tax=Eretmocerus hayati TaxID=131215 RepID=A0ACC2N5K2_9HYME|nr:hypothetical protein QAD02_007900 [Eretmocerus hayati]
MILPLRTSANHRPFDNLQRVRDFLRQDLKPNKGEECCQRINEILNNPPSVGSQRGSGNGAEGDLQNLLNNMSQQQLMQLFGGVGQIGGLGNLLGSINRPPNSSRVSTTSSTTAETSNVSSPSVISSRKPNEEYPTGSIGSVL